MPAGKKPGPGIKDEELYEKWTVEELRERAAEIGIEGRSSMDKSELVEALRDH